MGSIESSGNDRFKASPFRFLEIQQGAWRSTLRVKSGDDESNPKYQNELV